MNATEKQLYYISMLCIDCNFTLAQRLDYLQRICMRHPSNPKIESINDLTKEEASFVIGKLIQLKDELRNRNFGI